MRYGELRTFKINYPDMNNKHVDYRRHQIMRELEFIKCGYICIGWDKTLKSGTMVTYVKADEFEIMEKLGQLEEELKNVKRIK